MVPGTRVLPGTTGRLIETISCNTGSTIPMPERYLHNDGVPHLLSRDTIVGTWYYLVPGTRYRNTGTFPGI